ncbi:PrgI family mobile element protein [Clostridioides sp. ZZV15-6598]|uniref:PrgI family mobile element protein n=1 Tax=Clostridioides sp. ZZV15-6598 TaxID=2811501 RepID=UPI001D123A68|nr:PrgI family protein [Clostridioides sp. ZZV15-6598]
MTNFQIPFDLSFEDKIIGGKLSLRQAIWFSVPVGFFMMIIQRPQLFVNYLENGATTVNFLNILMIFFFEVFMLAISSTFSFVRINGLYLDSYVLLRVKFLFRKKVIKHYE